MQFAVNVNAPDESIETVLREAIEVQLKEPDINPFVEHFLKACTVFARQAAMLDRPLGTTYTIDITGGLFGDTGYGDVTIRILSESTAGIIPADMSIIGRGTHPGSDEPAPRRRRTASE